MSQSYKDLLGAGLKAAAFHRFRGKEITSHGRVVGLVDINRTINCRWMTVVQLVRDGYAREEYWTMA